MKEFRVNLYEEGEYNYQAAYGFEPNIHTYFHEDEEVRPCMMVVPGGGYCMVCGHEGEVVAREFYKRGMNTVVLSYTSDITMSVPLKKQPLMDISRAMKVLRKNHEEYHIDPECITVCGFSAGGHVCATLCTHFEELEEKNTKYEGISDRPNASILCYPVITSGEFTHIYSMQALIGKEMTEEELLYFSAEKQVKKNTPPAFIWQTVEDDLVPVENSYLYAQALRRAGIRFAHYAFPVGGHGMSIANEELASGRYPGAYTYEQLNLALEHIKNHTAVNVSEQRYEELTKQFFGNTQEEAEKVEENTADNTEYKPAVPDVSRWPELAWDFLQQVILKKS